MTAWRGWAMRLALFVLAAQASAAADDADDQPANSEAAAMPALSHEQRQAAGIRVAHPIDAKVPERIGALGLVLDATVLVSDDGELRAAEASQRSTAAELERLRALYDGGGTSMRLVEAAQTEHAKSQAQKQLAEARFALHWGPLLALPPGERRKVIDAAATGRSLLMRADLPGRHSLGTSPAKALVEVDGTQVTARVLGALRQSGDVQSAGLLIEVRGAPAGFGPGARVPVALMSADRKGLLLPRDAVLYDETGSYVYKQLTEGKGEEKTRYVPVKVTLLSPSGEGWLVEGVDDDDDIVVHGAGVLWSLQGVGTHAVDDDD